MNKKIAKFAITTILLFFQCGYLCADKIKTPISTDTVTSDKSAVDTAYNAAMADEVMAADADILPVESEGLHKSLKKKFIEGNAVFMSFVALILVIGLAFCIERIIFLTLSEIDAKRFMSDIGRLIDAGNVDEAKKLCHNTRGPVASICEKTLERIDESVKDIERGIVSYGSVQSANLEVGCSWITMFIAMAPSLGFLGTVVGIVMTFEQIQMAGDISPTIVAAGMKVALLTTIFGLVAALVLQLFYNYILSKIEHITSQMEESAISLIDHIIKYKQQAVG
ncbi:MAG: MotA/TolQ/ExbB proton channel family protein [Prevotella sp.]